MLKVAKLSRYLLVTGSPSPLYLLDIFYYDRGTVLRIHNDLFQLLSSDLNPPFLDFFCGSRFGSKS